MLKCFSPRPNKSPAGQQSKHHLSLVPTRNRPSQACILACQTTHSTPSVPNTLMCWLPQSQGSLACQPGLFHERLPGIATRHQPPGPGRDRRPSWILASTQTYEAQDACRHDLQAGILELSVRPFRLPLPHPRRVQPPGERTEEALSPSTKP